MQEATALLAAMNYLAAEGATVREVRVSSGRHSLHGVSIDLLKGAAYTATSLFGIAIWVSPGCFLLKN